MYSLPYLRWLMFELWVKNDLSQMPSNFELDPIISSKTSNRSSDHWGSRNDHLNSFIYFPSFKV